MKKSSIIAFAVGALATGSLALLIAAGPDHEDHKGMDGVTSDEMQEMQEMSPEDLMAAVAKISTPNEYHKALGAMVGNWKAKTSFIMDPSQPAMEGEGSMTVEWILGGRFIKSSFQTEFMGEAFEGLGFTGYDVAHEEYISTWMDTMSTKIMLMTGGEEAGDALVMHGTATTPMGDNPMKIVSKFTDADTWVDSFYDKMPDGTWFNSGSITYSRD